MLIRPACEVLAADTVQETARGGGQERPQAVTEQHGNEVDVAPGLGIEPVQPNLTEDIQDERYGGSEDGERLEKTAGEVI